MICFTQRWGYPRENLIYLREIGEGQFGKVHLMNAKVRVYIHTYVCART